MTSRTRGDIIVGIGTASASRRCHFNRPKERRSRLTSIRSPGKGAARTRVELVARRRTRVRFAYPGYADFIGRPFESFETEACPDPAIALMALARPRAQQPAFLRLLHLSIMQLQINRESLTA
jgi:hypothetical protein